MIKEDEGVGDENETKLESTNDDESFHCSDYDFREDGDDIIYKNCVATNDRVNNGQIGIYGVGFGGKTFILNVERRGTCTGT